MPAHARTSTALILAAANEVLDLSGLDGVTMGAVADRVGIRAPSLHKRIATRGQLLQMLADSAMADLEEELSAAVQQADDPRLALADAVRSLRGFAHRRPNAYGLIFGPVPPGARASASASRRAAEPVMEVFARLVAPHEVLPAARTFTAWASGFISMELAGVMRNEGDIDVAFEWGLERITRAICRPHAGAS